MRCSGSAIGARMAVIIILWNTGGQDANLIVNCSAGVRQKLNRKKVRRLKNEREVFTPGDRVVMVNCLEAETYKDKVWTVGSNPCVLGCKEEVVLLVGKSGGFSTKCLKKIEAEPIRDSAQ